MTVIRHSPLEPSAPPARLAAPLRPLDVAAAVACVAGLVLAMQLAPWWAFLDGAWREWAWFVIAGVCLIALAARPDQLRAAVRGDPLLWALLGLAVASPLWAVQPSRSVAALWPLAVTALVGLTSAVRFGRRGTLTLIAAAAAVMLLGSIAYQALLLDLADLPWQGPTNHRNILAAQALLGAVAGASLALRPGWLRLPGVALLVVALVVLAASRSVTPTVALAATVALVAAVALARAAVRAGSRRARRLAVATLAVGGLAAAAAIATAPAVLSLLGRQPHLTGRVPLWAELAAGVGERPLLGHGLESFWFAADTAAAVQDAARWEGLPPSHAHNAFLDVGLELGLAGLALMVGSIGLGLWRAGRRLWTTGTPAEVWPLAALVALAVWGMAEGPILRGERVLLIVWIAVVVSLPRGYAEMIEQSTVPRPGVGGTPPTTR